MQQKVETAEGLSIQQASNYFEFIYYAKKQTQKNTFVFSFVLTLFMAFFVSNRLDKYSLIPVVQKNAQKCGIIIWKNAQK